MDKIGLYIHVPFCKRKCPYCDFYSIIGNETIMDMYTEKVCSTLKDFKEKINKQADTLYLGGGTPNLLGEERISKILEAAKETFLTSDSEITIEMNPTKGKMMDFNILKSIGINRISVGLQSANDIELLLLGREHNSFDAKRLITKAQDSGFNNISVDLMLGIQKQTEKSLLRSIEFCNSLNIQHISSYMLKIEKGTPYYYKKEKLTLPNEDNVSRLYLLNCEELEKSGFIQYEISNFSKPQFESKHNLKYWDSIEYLGIGPAAHSLINNKRFYYPKSIDKFLLGESPIYDCDSGSIEEYSMLKLRLSKGLVNSEFKARFGFDIPKSYYEKSLPYEKYGLLTVDENSIRFTKKGFLVSNELISKIIL